MSTAIFTSAAPNKWRRTVDYLKRLHLSWLTVSTFAVVLAFADGFVITAMQGAVGAIERQHGPFESWLVNSALMVPVYMAAIVVAMILARRWSGSVRRSWVRTGVAALVVVASTVVVGVAQTAASSAYDYTLQSRHIDLMVATHALHNTPTLFASADVNTTPKCDAACVQKHSTIVAHLRAVALVAKLLTIINLVLVAWLLAVRGGRLWMPPKKIQRARVQEAMVQPALA